MTIVARGGGSAPKAWNAAHSTAMSNPHHTMAPSSPISRSRARAIAVRQPEASVAGTAAARDEDGAEEDHVAGERADLEQRGDGQPGGVPVVEPVPRVGEAGDLGEDEVEEGQRRDDEHAEEQRVPAREVHARHLLLDVERY